MTTKKILLLSLCLVVFATYAQTAYKQLSNIPTIYITTENKASVQKETYTKGSVTVISSDSTECQYETSMQIKGRGNSTWNMAKKPYCITFDQPQHFLSQKAEAKSWHFIADYADKTLMRGAIAFHLSRFIGLEFTPAERFADVVLNGEFVGNYHITDQMEVATDRINVELQNSNETIDISGGYFCEIDGWASSEPHYFYTTKSMPITIHYPTNINNAQNNYIKNFVQTFEDRLFGANYKDPQLGYRAMVDTNSLINWYVAVELVGNSDCFWSTFFYKKKNIDKLFFGPMWDYDIAFNNDDRLGDATEKVMRESAHNPLTWIQRLWTDPWFRHAAHRRLQEIVDKGVEKALCNYIDSKANELEQSQKLNFQKWDNLSTKVYREVYLFDTYAKGVAYLKEYLNKHISFLLKNFAAADTEETEEEKNNLLQEGFLYTIKSKTSGNLIDVTDQSTVIGAKLITWKTDNARESQNWYLQKLNDNYYQVINYKSNLAMEDNGHSNQLSLNTPDTLNSKQLWELYDLNDGYYMFINKNSGYTMNNSGGGTSNGTPVIAYDTNRSSISSNRRWALTKGKAINESALPIVSETLFTYDTSTNLLKIPVSDKKTIMVYNIAGCLHLYESTYEQTLSLAMLPHGMYIAHIQAEGKQYNVKLNKY